MKKLIVFIFLLFLSSHAAAEEQVRVLTIQDLHIGDSYEQIVSFLGKEGISYESYNDPEFGIIINVKDYYSAPSLSFDSEAKLSEFDIDISSDTLMDAIAELVPILGNPDIISQPYIDYDSDESSYVEYIVPLYILWIKEDALYELQMTSYIYTDFSNSFWDGLEIDIDDSPRTSFDLCVYSSDKLDEVLYMYD